VSLLDQGDDHGRLAISCDRDGVVTIEARVHIDDLPPPITIMVATRPCDWSEPARSILFTQAQIATDRVLDRKR
jgi:hypothetical protein